MSRLARKEIDMIVDLREAGWSFSRIGKKFGLSASGIAYHCLAQAAEPPKPRKSWAVKGPQIYMRNGRPVRRYTSDEDAALIDLEQKGETLSAIGLALGRSRNSIRMRLMTLARHEERQAA